MIKLDISGVHTEIDDKTKDYVTKKISKLLDHIPRRARNMAAAEVKIIKSSPKSADKWQCEIVLNLPHKRLVAKDSTVNALAAVDIVEQKILGQIRRYKVERRADGVRTGGIMSRVKRSLRKRRDK
ncbi:MAG: HPF/RaiA family ribosome-associated protein [Candidatus Nomurabacteria bacterium]|jgi:ribosomal subunit interface protein|nr:HPF/RaiA family ribosome-associated protein [Candidatus Nomurabacteria bacterium]